MKKVETNILLIILFTLFMGIFCGCEKKSSDVEKPCKFDFLLDESIEKFEFLGTILIIMRLF